MISYSYFDEDYFENGEAKGTAYRRYIQSSRTSPLYREIAEACAALKPRRALEIGCATGIVVARLNQLGVETHGIDVSEWAVQRREHPNVTLAGAEALPFPDGHFDLVYSVHALEHIPEELAEAAFREIRRVSAPGAVQFHTLPIIGLGPYVGEREAVIAGLKHDPTHHLLHDEAWWLARFAEIGFSGLGANFLFRNEERADLSVSQLLLTSAGDRAGGLEAVRRWNGDVAQALIAERGAARAGIRHPSTGAPARSLSLAGVWGDVETFDSFVFDAELLFTATVEILASAPLTLRFCFLSGDGAEADLIRTYSPGVTVHQFRKDDLIETVGAVGLVRRVLFGGQGRAEVRVSLAGERHGKLIFAL